MGLSNEADCRSVVSADLDLDGRPDLLVVEKEPGDVETDTPAHGGTTRALDLDTTAT